MSLHCNHWNKFYTKLCFDWSQLCVIMRCCDDSILYQWTGWTIMYNKITSIELDNHWNKFYTKLCFDWSQLRFIMPCCDDSILYQWTGWTIMYIIKLQVELNNAQFACQLFNCRVSQCVFIHITMVHEHLGGTWLSEIVPTSLSTVFTCFSETTGQIPGCVLGYDWPFVCDFIAPVDKTPVLTGVVKRVKHNNTKIEKKNAIL
jgi:hypothetical protein